MSRQCSRVSWWVAIALILAAPSLAAQAGARDRSDPRPIAGGSPLADFADSWFLVRLDRPLAGKRADGSFLLDTGRPALDGLIREAGVHRIDLALRVSARVPADPEAFRRWGFDRTYRFHVPIGSDVRSLVERFGELVEVDYAEPDHLGEPSWIPGDPMFGNQWHLHQTSDADIDAPEAWDIDKGSARVVIAVNDSGIDVDHPDLDAVLWCNPGEIDGNGVDDDGDGYIDDFHGWNFGDDNGNVDDTHGHGTMVSSYAMTETDNDEGIAGVCPGCRIMTIKRASDSHSDFTDALVWAVDHGANVMNGSYSTLGGSATLVSGLGYAADAGVPVVVSTGNDSMNIYKSPAKYAETIAVGATDINDDHASFSNRGWHVDVVAPGENVLGAEMGGGYGNHTGTSFSTPMVSGLAGLIFSVDPSAGREQIRHLLQSGAEDEVGQPGQDTPGHDYYHGWGRINAYRSVEAARAGVSLRVEGKSATRVYFATTNPLADSWDFVRGDLGALSEDVRGVDLGSLTCIENDSGDPDTAGNEDTETPLPGEGFFYLARFNAPPGVGPYGGSSRNRDRLPFPVAAWRKDGGQATARFGATATAGDVNGDGYDDVVVGAEGYDGTLEDEGAVYLYLGSETGLQPDHAWMATGGQPGSGFGYAVSPAGDVNGDGYDDVLVGAYGYDDGETDEGRAYVYLGSASGLSETADWTVESDQSGSEFGSWVGAAGDVNDDGYDDVLVGAYRYDNGETDEGRLFLYFGSSSGPSPAPDWTEEPDQASAYFGFGFDRAGDLNGDGIDDVAVGAPAYDGGQTDEGRVFVYYGASGSGPGTVPDVELEIDVAGAWFGTGAAGAGDVDGDGVDDLLVSAVYYSNGQGEEGAVFLYPGATGGMSTAHTWSFESDQIGAEMGWVCWTAGDVDNDGYDDVVVGAPYYDHLRTDEGKIWVFSGSASGLSTTPVWTMTGGQTSAEAGYYGFRAGDVNGDLRGDIVVGAPAYGGGFSDEGRAYVFHGPLSEATGGDCPQ